MQRGTSSNAKQWLLRLVILCTLIQAVMAICVRILDPLFQYGAKDGVRFTSTTFSTPGLIKNHGYDTALVGSSMIWDIDIPTFRQSLSVNPLKVTIGGMSLREMKAMLALLNDTGKARSYYICLDLVSFSVPRNEQKLTYPTYLSDTSLFNDYRYFWGYEVWMRFMPVNFALNTVDKLHIGLPREYELARQIDYLGASRTQFQYGMDVVMANRGDYGVSTVDTQGLFQLMQMEADALLDSIDFANGEYTFFFPPYSALYWVDTQHSDYYAEFMHAKQYIIEKLLSQENVRIFDFQSADFIVDLDNYKDTTHYSPEIGNRIIECFADEKYLVTPSNVRAILDSLDSTIDLFRKVNPDLANPPQ